MKNVLISIAICAALLFFGIRWYQQKQEDVEVQRMKDQTEQTLRTRAHEYYSKMRLECAKHGRGLPCEQQALLDCRALYGDRCEGN
jgi:hypothetical protein